MKARKSFVISGAALILVGLGVIAFLLTRSAVTQPIAFSHQVHMNTSEEKIECSTCHRYYKERKVAGHPSIDICTNCHSTAKTPEQEKIVSYDDRGEEIPWKRVYKIPDFAYFSHSRHVVAGKIECFTCHGQVKNVDYPLVKPLVPISMNNCISCHKKRQVSTDCDACHK